jgi:hypothetical protein
MLFRKLVPSCLHPTLRSTLNRTADIESDSRRHDVLFDLGLTANDACAVKRDQDNSLPVPNKGQSEARSPDSQGVKTQDWLAKKSSLHCFAATQFNQFAIAARNEALP